MMTTNMRSGAGALLALAAMVVVGVRSGEAQQLAERVAAVRDGDVRFHFAARPGVCGNTNGNTWYVRHRNTRDVEWDNDCMPGPVRVVVRKEAGRITDVRSYVGGRWIEGPAADLGQVSAGEAANYLVRLAASEAGTVADRAVGAAVLADSADVTQPLLGIARDESRPNRVRRTATFWVAQAAGERITRELGDLANSDSTDLEVREHAVFALSQRPREEGIPALIQIARGTSHPRIRQRAMFWLGQSGDERALRLFEEILRGGG